MEAGERSFEAALQNAWFEVLKRVWLEMLATRSPRPGSIGLESPVSELALDDVKHNMGKRYKVTTSQ